jgi:hypothetical protein
LTVSPAGLNNIEKQWAQGGRTNVCLLEDMVVDMRRKNQECILDKEAGHNSSINENLPVMALA